MLIALKFNMFFSDKLQSLVKDECLAYYDLSLYDPRKTFDKANFYFDWEYSHQKISKEIEIRYKSLKSFYCPIMSGMTHVFENLNGITNGIFIEFFDEIDEDSILLADNNVGKIKSINLFCNDHEIVSLHELKLKFVIKIHTPKLIYIPFFNDSSLIDIKYCKIVMGYYSKIATKVGIHFFMNSDFISDD